MYNKFQLATRYFRYFITASNGKGHGIHSPFVFNFITRVLNDKRHFYSYDAIEATRVKLLNNTDSVAVEDYGAGSNATQSQTRKIATIAQWSLKSKKYAQLLFRIVQYYRPQTVIELGTSLGITTSYFAAANNAATVYSFEGAPAISSIARQVFQSIGLTNIQLIEGNFDETVLPALKNIGSVDFAFIDGNHRKEPTLRYFQWLLSHATPSSIIVFDDIHWSAEMEAAWTEAKNHPAVTCSIDLFFVGIVLLSPDFKVKQHFVIRY